MVRDIGRIPAERSTTYDILKPFEKAPEKVDSLDQISDARKFGSYFELIKINKFRYKNPIWFMFRPINYLDISQMLLPTQSQ